LRLKAPSIEGWSELRSTSGPSEIIDRSICSSRGRFALQRSHQLEISFLHATRAAYPPPASSLSLRRMLRDARGPIAARARRVKFNCVQTRASVEFPRRRSWKTRDKERGRGREGKWRRQVARGAVSRCTAKAAAFHLYSSVVTAGHLFSGARNYIVSRSAGGRGPLFHPSGGTPFRGAILTSGRRSSRDRTILAENKLRERKEGTSGTTRTLVREARRDASLPINYRCRCVCALAAFSRCVAARSATSTAN